MEPVRLRKAHLSDVPAMQECARRAYAEALVQLDGMPDVVIGMAEDLRENTGYVVELSGTIAGFLIMGLEGPIAKLINLAVDPDHAGQGVARRLLDHATMVAKTEGKAGLTLVTHAGMTDTLAFYNHLGWQETARDGHSIFLRLPF
ncbi:MAG: GNAT family N-acetyltransferase [Pseudomonadota bacterium]